MVFNLLVFLRLKSCSKSVLLRVDLALAYQVEVEDLHVFYSDSDTDANTAPLAIAIAHTDGV